MVKTNTNAPNAWILHCCDTWRELQKQGAELPNKPQDRKTLEAIARMRKDLLDPIEAKFGTPEITYGFAGPELVRAIRKRAKGGPSGVSPSLDQHAGHELDAKGRRICDRDGIAVDLRVPKVSSEDVVAWVREEDLPFDRIYIYGAKRPFHISWSAAPIGQVVRMMPTANSDRLRPQVVVRGRRA